MAKLSLNSLSNDIFTVKDNGEGREANQRAEIVALGRLLFREHAASAVKARDNARQKANTVDTTLTRKEYNATNEQFRKDALVYAASKACAADGRNAPADFNEFTRRGMEFYKDKTFYKVLQGIFQEVVTPILPVVYAEAVDDFADTVEVSFGETASISVESNDIIVFQDSSWGASRSVPDNTLYAKDYTLAPSPKTAALSFKWHQLVGNNVDFGKFFANLAAGMYAKTTAMFNEALTTASANTALIPTGLSYTFSNANFVTLAQKIAAVNGTTYGNVIARGTPLALSKVLPTQATGSVNVNMDAALATLLGRDYIETGYMGRFMGVDLYPLMDAINPATQYSTVDTILDNTKIWMMYSRGRKPMTIGYTAETPITIEFDPTETANFTIGANLTIALDTVATFASKIGYLTI